MQSQLDERAGYLRPSESETERRVAVTSSITRETGTEGQPSGHLTKSGHDHEDNGAHKSIGDEERARTGCGQGFTGTNDETSSESTTNSNHTNVTSLETSVKHRVGVSLETSNAHVLFTLKLGIVGGNLVAAAIVTTNVFFVHGECIRARWKDVGQLLHVKLKMV